jgi:hypothetical protein
VVTNRRTEVVTPTKRNRRRMSAHIVIRKATRQPNQRTVFSRLLSQAVSTETTTWKGLPVSHSYILYHCVFLSTKECTPDSQYNKMRCLLRSRESRKRLRSHLSQTGIPTLRRAARRRIPFWVIRTYNLSGEWWIRLTFGMTIRQISLYHKYMFS